MLAACQPALHWHHSHTFGPDGWAKADTVLALADSLQHHPAEGRVVLRMLPESRYPYQGLDLELRQISVSRVQCDTLRLRLTTPEGDQRGRGVALRQYEATFRPLSPQAAGPWRLQLRHLMRHDPVEDVLDVSLRME